MPSKSQRPALLAYVAALDYDMFAEGVSVFQSRCKSRRKRRSSRRNASVLPVREESQNVSPENTVTATEASTPRCSMQAIAALPKARVQKQHKEAFGWDDSVCTICCERLIDTFALTRLGCGHVYHVHCAVTWLRRSCVCPECRYEMPSDDVNHEMGRVERMKNRTPVKCQCSQHSQHECFFHDPSRALTKQFTHL